MVTGNPSVRVSRTSVGVGKESTKVSSTSVVVVSVVALGSATTTGVATVLGLDVFVLVGLLGFVLSLATIVAQAGQKRVVLSPDNIAPHPLHHFPRTLLAPVSPFIGSPHLV